MEEISTRGYEGDKRMIETKEYQDFIDAHRNGSWGNATLGFQDVSQEELHQMIKEVNDALTMDSSGYEEDPYEMNQNWGPTIKELIQFDSNLAKGKLYYDGYLVGNPRSDARVSVDACTIRSEDIDEVFDFIKRFSGADGTDMGRDGDSFYAYYWWD